MIMTNYYGRNEVQITVAIEEVHLGDEVSIGGPRKVVKWKTEQNEEVKLGFGSYPVGESVTFPRGTLIDIEIGYSDSYKAYAVYDGDSIGWGQYTPPVEV